MCKTRARVLFFFAFFLSAGDWRRITKENNIFIPWLLPQQLWYWFINSFLIVPATRIVTRAVILRAYLLFIYCTGLCAPGIWKSETNYSICLKTVIFRPGQANFCFNCLPGKLIPQCLRNTYRSVIDNTWYCLASIIGELEVIIGERA